MPTHYGITIVLTAGSTKSVKLPEFPYPESLEVEGTKRSTPNWSNSRLSRPTLSPGPPDISVYIPFIPESQFRVEFSIDDTAIRLSEWYFFKLYINGRHIVSWGTNSKEKPSGEVTRGLFTASNMPVPGNLLEKDKCEGTEVRNLYFGRQGGLSNEKYGLIEVLVFRSTGQNQIKPRLEAYQPQQNSGIEMPSIGVLKTPNASKYYEWKLKDPKDNPFTVFRFHYQTWEFLQSSKVVPGWLRSSDINDILHFQRFTDTQFANKDYQALKSDSSADLGILRHNTCKSMPSEDSLLSYYQNSNNEPTLSDARKAGTDPKECERWLLVNDHVATVSKNGEPIMDSHYVPAEFIQNQAIKIKGYQKPKDRNILPEGSYHSLNMASVSSQAPSISDSLIEWAEEMPESPEASIETAREVPIVPPKGSPEHLYGRVSIDPTKRPRRTLFKSSKSQRHYIPPPKKSPQPEMPSQNTVNSSPPPRSSSLVKSLSGSHNKELDYDRYGKFGSYSIPESQWIRRPCAPRMSAGQSEVMDSDRPRSKLFPSRKKQEI